MSLIRITGAAALALFAVMAWYLSPLEPDVLVLQFAFTPGSFASVVHAWPVEHLARYRAHLPLDALFLLAYGAFGYFLASRSALFRALPPTLRRGATWLLPVAASLDAVENGLHWWLTAAPRFGVPLLYAISASCSTIKWALVFAFGLVVVYALAKRED